MLFCGTAHTKLSAFKLGSRRKRREDKVLQKVESALLLLLLLLLKCTFFSAHPSFISFLSLGSQLIKEKSEEKGTAAAAAQSLSR